MSFFKNVKSPRGQKEPMAIRFCLGKSSYSKQDMTISIVQIPQDDMHTMYVFVLQIEKHRIYTLEVYHERYLKIEMLYIDYSQKKNSKYRRHIHILMKLEESNFSPNVLY